MRVINFIKDIFLKNKSINISKLPSQGLFYKEDFRIKIKKVDKIDILEYERDYDRENIAVVLSKIKNIVEKNIILSDGYTFRQIKSIDVIFIFLEIVKLTKNKPVKLDFYNEEIGNIDKIEFGENSFNYYKLEDNIINCWDKIERCFNINGYKFTLPSIGIENSLTNFLIIKSYGDDSVKYNSYNYNFTYFLGDKYSLSFGEIENLIQIFNYDMTEEEIEKTDNIVKIFMNLQKYSLIRNNKIIEMSSKINLQEIWK